MKKIIAFAGSNSSTSINHALVSHVANKIIHHNIKVIKLTDFPLPIFGEDLEKEKGYPETLSKLLNEIRSQDALIISVNEHNAGISAFFKNVLDWLSRIELKFMEGKKVLLLSTSPGKRGALSALQYTESIVPRYSGELVASFAFPSFSANFSVEDNKVINADLASGLDNVIETFLASLE
ncbi:MAG: NAD(P)H-dependent oxidoreductase [Bacteroidia bacterium]|nr:NAD(P)H-dependent oxidoreductase [Bacteroidia bacterium]NNF31262.1 NAD(P)H-dependent oxidoreductase [Flavobacteriaceae bacterium]MBT8275888.1 NAD(P)H-dependent oxidoreductase [Bacteroidia bacterium]NNJ82947.1 NAD(P)H-dependent oxidoreductase [Flavobacteriaceae bacterium]NNK54543.1 NAD(P)H-dependent oxidoreductase [Flavobacteriaceae bacterium]